MNLILSMLAALASAGGLSPPTVSETTVYEGAKVWNGHGFDERDLAIRGGHLVPLPRRAPVQRRVDLRGLFVVPAYGNAHFHVTNPREAASRAALRDGVFYLWNPNTVVMNTKARSFFARQDTYDVAVSQGGITEPGGHPEPLYIEILGPRIYGGRGLDYFLGNAFHYGRTPAEIDEALERLQNQLADFVKSYLLHSEEYAQRRDDPTYRGKRGINPANFPYLVQAARQRGLRVAVHVESVNDLLVAAEASADMAAHLPLYGAVMDDEELVRGRISRSDARRVARSRMLLVPTYALAREHYDREERDGKLDPSERDRIFEVQAQNVRTLLAAGAVVIAGTDSKVAIFDEMEHLVAIGGMTSAQAAQAALVTGRNLFPLRRIGCFEPGCEADFLALSADPTQDITALRRIELRVKSGRKMEVAADPEKLPSGAAVGASTKP